MGAHHSVLQWGNLTCFGQSIISQPFYPYGWWGEAQTIQNLTSHSLNAASRMKRPNGWFVHWRPLVRSRRIYIGLAWIQYIILVFLLPTGQVLGTICPSFFPLPLAKGESLGIPVYKDRGPTKSTDLYRLETGKMTKMASWMANLIITCQPRGQMGPGATQTPPHA